MAIIVIAIFVLCWFCLALGGHMLTPFIPVISPEPVLSGYLGFYSGVISLGIIPLIALIWVLFRLIWGYRVGKIVKRTTFGIWFVTLFVFITTLIFTSKSFTRDYSHTDTVIESVSLSGTPLQIDVKDYHTQHSEDENWAIHFGNVIIYDDIILIPDQIEIRLKPANSDATGLSVSKRTRCTGLNRSAARKNMDYPRHNIFYDNNVLVLDDFYTLGKKDKYRAQKLDYTVTIPIGTKVAISQYNDVFRSSDFIDKMRPMENSMWKMTEKGLLRMTESL